MTLGELCELHSNNVLSIKFEEGADTAVIAGSSRITYDIAERMCTQLGWLEHKTNAFETIKKTGLLISSIKKSIIGKEWPKEFMDTITIELQNKHAMTYGKTFDRYVLYINNTKYTIIHGMEHAGASWVVYVNGCCNPSAKCRSLNKVAEFLVKEVNN